MRCFRKARCAFSSAGIGYAAWFRVVPVAECAALMTATARSTADHSPVTSVAATETRRDLAGADAGRERERQVCALADLPYQTGMPSLPK